MVGLALQQEESTNKAAMAWNVIAFALEAHDTFMEKSWFSSFLVAYCVDRDLLW
jgi:hypothetical protein